MSNDNKGPKNSSVDVSAAMFEFVAMMLFVYVGCGSAVSNTFKAGGAVEGGNDAAWVCIVALQFGLAITTLAYASRGGQINCAVTLGLVLGGTLDVVQGIVNVVAQLLGSVIGAALLLLTVSPGDAITDELTDRDFTGGLGSNGINGRYNAGNALVGEIMMTALLVLVVYETAVSKRSIASSNAPIAIGFAVFLAHVVLINIDGCSINPTRSFGPAVVASINGNAKVWNNHWVFWVGPLIGAAIVGLTRGRMIMAENEAIENARHRGGTSKGSIDGSTPRSATGSDADDVNDQV